MSERKDKSPLHLPKYVEDASRTAANSDGDLKSHGTSETWQPFIQQSGPEKPQQGGSLSPLSIYSQQAIVLQHTLKKTRKA
jgi:hypothetical protein